MNQKKLDKARQDLLQEISEDDLNESYITDGHDSCFTKKGFVRMADSSIARSMGPQFFDFVANDVPKSKIISSNQRKQVHFRQYLAKYKDVQPIDSSSDDFNCNIIDLATMGAAALLGAYRQSWQERVTNEHVKYGELKSIFTDALGKNGPAKADKGLEQLIDR